MALGEKRGSGRASKDWVPPGHCLHRASRKPSLGVISSGVAVVVTQISSKLNERWIGMCPEGQGSGADNTAVVDERWHW